MDKKVITVSRGLIFKLNPKKLKERFNKEIDHDKTAVKGNEMVKCPDQVVGVIEVSLDKGNGSVKWCDNNIEKIKDDGTREVIENNGDYNNIVIVLESPHQHEFSKCKALGPAMGNTGKVISETLCENIFKYLVMGSDKDFSAFSEFKTEIENGKYYIHLVNAIQVQCSLGILETSDKDKILKEIWNDNQCVQSNFINRLKACSPSVIINCCTKAIQEEVQDEINKNFECLKLKGCHPSSAYFYRGFEK